jgi:hypothetical protein
MDGGFEIFLVLMFVFWILEGLAKARQRPRPPGLPEGMPPEQRSPEEYRASYEERMPPEVPEEQRVPTAQRIPDRGQRPPTLLEILAAELQRAKEEAQRQSGQASKGPSSSADRSLPPKKPTVAGSSSSPLEESVAELRRQLHTPKPRAKPSPRRTSSPMGPKAQPPRRSGSVAPSRPAARGKKSDLTLRGERGGLEQFAERDREERTSDAWASGEMEAERGSLREAEQAASLETDRAAVLEAKRAASLEATPSARRHGLQRAAIKESQKPLAVTQRKAPAAATSSLDPRRLVGASPAQLRQILILNEVLGPPVGLRDQPPE